MIQEILTYIIVLFAFLYAGYKIFLVFIPAKKRMNKISRNEAFHSQGCNNCSGACVLKELTHSNEFTHVRSQN